MQPDAFLRILERAGGQSRGDEDDYLEGAPELIVEVAASSAAYDLHEKLRVYRRNGVQEYVVLLARERETRWHRLVEGAYELIRPDENGVLRSQVFPGLHFHPGLFWADKPAKYLGQEKCQSLAESDWHLRVRRSFLFSGYHGAPDFGSRRSKVEATLTALG